MTTCHRLLLASAVVTTATVAVSAQGLDIRPGQWRWTLTMGGVPAAMPSSLPPDVQEKIRARAAQPHTFEDCVTAEDLKNVRLGVDDDEDCEVFALKVTARAADYQRTCSGDTPRRDSVHMESASPTALRATITRISGPGPATTTMTGTWLAATCKPEPFASLP